MPNPQSPEAYQPVGDRVSIFLRGTAWYANYQHDGRQVRRSLRTRNKREATLRARRLEAELARGDDPAEAVVATIGAAVEAYLDHHETEDRAPKTLAKYRHVAARVRQLADERRITHVSQLDFHFADSFKSHLRNIGNGAKSIYTATIILRSIVRFAHRRRMSDVDPLTGYKIARPKPTPQPCWTWEQSAAIVAKAPETYRPLFAFLRETGCRIGEAKYLKWDDVQLEAAVAKIRPKEGWKPKTGDQRRIPLTPRAVEVLGLLSSKGRWVFKAPTSARHLADDRQISERRALNALKRVLRRLGLEGHLHTFRHTFISQALLHAPDHVVRSWVGHVDPHTIRLYTHVQDRASREYIERL